MGLKENKLVRNVAVKFRNQVDVKQNNHISLDSIHFVKNIFMINGENNNIDFLNGSYMRYYSLNIIGNDNQLEFGEGTTVTGKGNIRLKGNSNRLIIGKNCRLIDCTVLIDGDQNTIRFGDSCSLVGVEIVIERNNNSITVGSSTTFHGRGLHTVSFHLDEGTNISIGNDCMIANDVSLRSSDNHSILDQNGNRLNYAQDIIIGNHCWLCMQVIILKGTKIGNQCVVAAGSICNKEYTGDNLLIAGQPAKIAKTGINWDRERL